MTVAAIVSEGSSEDWLSALPNYQQALLQPLVQDGDYTNAATVWLTSSGSSDNAPYGGFRAGANTFYTKLLEQIHALLCTENGYEQERKSLLGQIQAGRAAVITYVSGVIAPHVGASPALLAPAVALTFALLASAGTETACETLSRIISDRSHS